MNLIEKKFLANYEKEKDANKRLESLYDFVNIYYDSSDSNEINILLKKELETYVKNGNIDGEALIRFMLAYALFETGDIKTGEEEIEKVFAIFDQVKNPMIRGQVTNFLAFMHSHRGNYDQAFHYAYECIREVSLAPVNKNSFWGVYTLGVFYFDLKDFVNSEKYYVEAVESFRKVENHYGVARAETGLSSIYIQNEKYKEAEVLLNRSLDFYKEIEVSSGQSRSLNDLGLIALRTGKPQKALLYFKEALEIRKKVNHVQGIATSLIDIASVLIELKLFEDVESHLDEAKIACEKVGNRAKLYRAHFLYSQLYRQIDQPWKSLEHYDLYDKLKSEVIGEASTNKIKELQTKMATEKSEKEAEIERLKNVDLKNAYDLISEQKLIVDEKQKEILASIHYAKRIQNSLLPTEKYIEKNLKRLRN